MAASRAGRQSEVVACSKEGVTHDGGPAQAWVGEQPCWQCTGTGAGAGAGAADFVVITYSGRGQGRRRASGWPTEGHRGANDTAVGRGQDRKTKSSVHV